MLKRSMILMMLAALLMTPGMLKADDAEGLVGRWEMTSVEADGQSEDVPEGTMAMTFNDDGTIELYEGGEKSDEGTYEVNGNELTVTTASDNVTETANFELDGDTLIFKMELAPGVEMTITLKRSEG